MNGKSKQEIENAISQVMTKFLKEQMGEEAEVVDIHSSFDVETGERIEIFTLSKDLGKACQV